jgi:hypothetical protein
VVAELRRLNSIREKALNRFSLQNVPDGTPLSELERVLVPLYLAHRYQTEAVAKLIGGIEYDYAVKGSETRQNDDWKVKPVSDQDQREALEALLATLDPKFLEIPANIRTLIPPPAYGYGRDRETFATHAGPAFDPMAAAESAADHTLQLLLNSNRLTRLLEQHASGPLNSISVFYLFQQLTNRSPKNLTPYQEELERAIEKIILHRIILLAADHHGNQQVTALAMHTLAFMEQQYIQISSDRMREEDVRAHFAYMVTEIRRFRDHPNEFEPVKAPEVPAGAPIGCW